MKLYILFLFLHISLFGQTQNKTELELIKKTGKHNLIPMYGEPYIEKNKEYIEVDNEFLKKIDKDFELRSTAANQFVLLGLDYFYQGDLQTSMKRFNQAWLLDTSNAGVFFGYWLVQSVLDSPSIMSAYLGFPSIEITSEFNAEKYYELGKKLDKNNEAENLTLDYACSSFSRFGQFEKGLQCCLTRLKMDETDTLTLQNLANTYMRMKEWNKALEIQKQSLSYRKNIAFVYHDIAWIFQEMNNLDSAEEYYLKAIKLSDITYFKPRVSYCFLMEKKNKCIHAIPVIDSCIEALPTEGFFHYTRGKLLLCSNQKKEAIIALKSAKKLGNEEAKSLLKEIKKNKRLSPN
ncbi:MAG: tetratricopeptide repeat protein [Flavobacteriales bacterium]|nr:tetratricopeptide repeat protein [Flavobacteriales bacterium]